MKTLVTGGAGFIGSHIQDKLIELGHEVAVVDCLRSGKKENLNPKATFFEVDVRDKEKLNEVFAKFSPEVVFHLAAQNEVPYSMEHPFEDEEINISGMINLLEACRLNKVRKVIYSNTGGAFYGDVPEECLPVTEDQDVENPTSFYGVSKLCAEVYLKLYGHIYGLSWVSLRYPNVYGPRQDGNREAGVVAIFTKKLLAKEQPTINGDGLHSRDYIYVGDVVEANIKALNYAKSDAFNASTATRITTREVFDALEEQLQTGIQPAYGPERFGDARHISLSAQKAKELLNWEAKINFKEGVRLTVEYYKK